MAKLDGETIIKYLAYGAGAVVVPATAVGIAGISGLLAKLPMWSTALFGAVTVGGIVLASVGAGAVDYFIFNK